MPSGGFRIRPLCYVKGCDRPHHGNGLCQLHYTRERKELDGRIRRPRRVYPEGRQPTKHGNIKDYNNDLNLRNRFGIPSYLNGGPDGYAGIEEYNRRLEKQGGVCAICGRPPKPDRRLCVDHNHGTKIVRGLLCQTCNGRILGRLERYRQATLLQLIAYLKKYDPENFLLKSSHRREYKISTRAKKRSDHAIGTAKRYERTPKEFYHD